MEQLFITNLTIRNVRHLKDVSIPLSSEQRKHLIMTGKNGSGKTSVVEALAEHLNHVFTDQNFGLREAGLRAAEELRSKAVQNGEDRDKLLQLERSVKQQTKFLEDSRKGLEVQFNHKSGSIIALSEKYHYILAYYPADRIFQAEQPKHVEKVQFKDYYELQEFPRNEFVKYLLDLKMTEALARSNKKAEKADEIGVWFEKLEQLLKQIFDDETVRIIFDEDTFEFHILQQGKEPFDFNTLSSGYQAVLDIVLDIIMRMQHQTKRSFDFNLPGIVLIDEIETHLHLELQRNIVPLLTTVFPNIQFIMTTHSPFILNSLEKVVIYDLENHFLVENGLDDVPYDGIVEGYFGAEKMSGILKEKFERYKTLTGKKNLTDDELCEIAEAEVYLDEIPDYLAIGIATEYRRRKLEFNSREETDG